jgi:polysaccharide chain length determinant protein (PEP-CTERM system associated)
MNITSSNKQSVKRASLGGLEYFSLSDYADLLWRHKWKMAAITCGITLIAIFVAHKIPNEYQAHTTIMVDPGKVPDSYVKSTATIDANQRLAILQEQILSETRLGQIADEMGLYRSLKAKETQYQIMDMMRKKITVEATTSAPPAKALRAFTVSFSSPSPIIAARVSNRLASLFIEENIKVREQQVIGTANFFDGQMQKAKEEVADKAQALSMLKARFATELPEAQNLHLQALTSSQLALREEADATNRAEQAKATLEAQLAASPNIVDLDASGRASNTGLEEQLEHLKGEMDQLRSHYGPNYPDVLTKAGEIENVQKKISELAAQGKSDMTTTKHGNPAIQSQIAQADEQIRKHEERQAQLQSQIKFHVTAISGVPAVQEQVASATNELALASDRYKRLEDRKFGADMFSDLESRQQGERFVLLEPAQPPDAPASPNRPLISSIAAAAGLLISLIVVAVLELIDPAVKTKREIAEYLKVPVFGEIPHVSGAEILRRPFWSAGAVAEQL